ncbi:MAG TPA: hypothetical protein DEG44_00560 [Candidatus Kerfeldbacteria bacterium]|nr:hypothetical protein [Candidatus Kerfeldbacteria bacterium]
MLIGSFPLYWYSDCMKKYGRALIILGIVLPAALMADDVSIIKKIRNVSFTDITHDQVTVQWTPPAGSNLRYRVWLKDASGNTLAKRRTQQTSIVLTYLYPETKYYIKVRAVQSSHVTGKWSIAQSFTTTAKPPVITNTIFAGDVMLSRYVARATEQTGDMAAPFVNIADEFTRNDLAFVNLEAPFQEYGPWDVADDSMTFKVNPQMMEGLQLAGIDIVSLANNHVYNAGQAGVDYTKQYLADNRIAYCLEHWDIREVNGLQFAFLCYSYDLNLDIDKLIADLQEVQNLGADVIIVSMHNGAEYTETISSSQSNFAHLAIDYGADLVIGHHPHVVQRMEEYNGKYIFYSLGNLIFDQDWSWPTQLGAVVKVTWENDQAKKIEFKPIKIDDDFQPRLMDFAEGKEVLGRLQVSDYELVIN